MPTPHSIVIVIVPGWRNSGVGHIKVESGHGDWPLGLALLQSLLGRTVPSGMLCITPCGL